MYYFHLENNINQKLTLLAFVCSLIGSLIWKDSLDTNWLKIVMRAVAIAETVVLAFIIYGMINW